MSASSDLARIQERILTEPNPFEDRAVGDPWDRAPITDVLSINRQGSDTVFQLLDGVHRDRRTRIVLLLGETGSGKSHLIHRILRQLGDRGLFVHVEPFGEASLVCKHILREIAVSLGRRRAPGTSPQIVEFAACVIRDAWRLLLEQRRADRSPKGREQIEKLRGSLDYVFNSFLQADKFRPIYEAILSYLCDEAPDLDRQFLKSFFRVLQDEHRATVLDWLKGKDLDQEDLRRIGAPESLLSEDEAFATIKALAILSRFYRPLAICFDQNESLLWGDDDSRFQALVTTLCRVHDFIPNCLLIFTCLKQVWVHDYTRRLQKPEIARFESRPVHLEGLTTRSAAELVGARMRRVFGDLEPPYPTYPFKPEFFEELAVLGLPMARELINLCLDRIEDLRVFGKVLEYKSPIQSSSSSQRLGEAGPWPWQQHLTKLWDATVSDLERLRKQRIEEGDEVVLEGDFPLDFDEGTLRWTLSRCFLRLEEDREKIAGCRIVSLETDLEKEKIDFVLNVEHRRGADRVALLVDNTRNANRFSAHLQSALGFLEAGHADRFFLVRNEPEPESWQRGRELLDKALAFGGKKLALDARSLVEILAFYRLCNQAQAGDLVADGKAVPRELVEQYVLETGKLAVIPLFESIFRQVAHLARKEEEPSGEVSPAPGAALEASADRENPLQTRHVSSWNPDGEPEIPDLRPLLSPRASPKDLSASREASVVEQAPVEDPRAPKPSSIPACWSENATGLDRPDASGTDVLRPNGADPDSGANLVSEQEPLTPIGKAEGGELVPEPNGSPVERAEPMGHPTPRSEEQGDPIPLPVHAADEDIEIDLEDFEIVEPKEESFIRER